MGGKTDVYDVEFDGANNGSPVVKIEVDVTPGEWVISRGKNSGTQDIYYLELKSVVEKLQSDCIVKRDQPQKICVFSWNCTMPYDRNCSQMMS